MYILYLEDFVMEFLIVTIGTSQDQNFGKPGFQWISMQLNFDILFNASEYKLLHYDFFTSNPRNDQNVFSLNTQDYTVDQVLQTLSTTQKELVIANVDHSRENIQLGCEYSDYIIQFNKKYIKI